MTTYINLGLKLLVMKRIILLATLIFSACEAQTLDTTSKTAEMATSKETETIATETVTNDFLISTHGIGKAKLGMSLGELKRISSQDINFEVIPFFTDTSAIAVSKQGIVQYYLLYPAGSTSHPDGVTPTDNDVITTILTDNQNYKTKEGIKVGTPIEEAEKIYGDAILAYNTEGEPREDITFGKQNPENIRFKASYFKQISNGLGFSGIYPEYPGVSYTTDKYRKDAAIAAIEVVCDVDNCADK